jgi:hypothetical protein
MTFQIKAEMLLGMANWEKNLKKSSRQLDGFGKSVKTIANGVKAGFGALGVSLSMDFIGNMIKGAEEARRADQRLDKVAKTINVFGKNLPNVTARLKQFADQQEISTGYTAEEIKAAQTKILTYTAVAKSAKTAGGIFDRTTQAAIDLAATGFGSVEGNADTLGKALANPLKGLGALQKQGFTYTKKQKEQFAIWIKQGKLYKAQNFILKDIESQVKGVGAASGSSLQKVSNAIGQMGDAIGEQFLPMVDQLVGWFQSEEGKKAIQDFAAKAKEIGEWFASPEGQKAFAGWMDDLKAMIKLAGDFLGLVGDVAKLLDGESNQRAVLADPNGRMALNPMRGGLGYANTSQQLASGTGPNMAGPAVYISVDPIDGKISRLLKSEAQKKGTTMRRLIGG